MNGGGGETPERGKLVIFDGSTFHSSSAPSTNIRMTLNINYEPSPRTSDS